MITRQTDSKGPSAVCLFYGLFYGVVDPFIGLCFGSAK